MTKSKVVRCHPLGKRCTHPAKWTVVMFGGDVLKLCGVHARPWRWQSSFKPLEGSK